MPDIPTLTLTQTSSQGNTHTIELEWRGVGPRLVATTTA